MTKPRVSTKCVANGYAGFNERIIEFGGENLNQGGLIAFTLLPNGKMVVDVYRQGCDVEVRVSKPEKSVDVEDLWPREVVK